MDGDLKLIRADNLDRLMHERGESAAEFSIKTNMNPGTVGTARRGDQFSDKSCEKITAALGLDKDFFDVDRRTGDKPEKKKKRGTIETKMVTIQFQGDTFNVSVEVTEKKAREMIMGLLHDG